MMYSNKLVASVKVGGKILREMDETVFVPYGSEYSILLKNMNTKRAVVNIEIDGQDVVPGGLVLSAGQSTDLERFVLNGDMRKGPRFKFIEKTSKISEHRGDKIEDGLIRITYQYEAPVITYRHPIEWMCGSGNFYDAGKTVVGGGPALGSGMSVNSCSIGSYAGANVTRGVSSPETTVYSAQASINASASLDGITVHGSESKQTFQNVTVGTLEAEKYVMVIQLKGAVGEQPVLAPVTVKRKIECSVCGTSNKTSSKFCKECGNNLTYQF